MDIYVLNENLEIVDPVDGCESIIWASRFFEHGDFELYLPCSKENLVRYAPDRYLMRWDSPTTMIIEKTEIETTEEDGEKLIVSGRCLKSLLMRRVVWDQTTFTNKTVEYIIRTLITKNIISPSESSRKIDNFVLANEVGFNDVVQNAQYTGDNLYDIIVELCKTYGYGWDINLIDGKFVFQLFKGVDRSYEQDVNPRVIFSDDFENLITSKYSKDTTTYKNVARVAGEGEGLNRTIYNVGTVSGIKRRELWVDANDLTSTTKNENDQDVTLTTAQYKEVLINRGKEKLSENVSSEVFEGMVETLDQYSFPDDFDLGDRVSVANDYGIKASPQIIEIIENEDESGYSVNPTFSTWEV